MVAESANFAEALQMVHDMNASMTPVGAVDRVENSILEEIELEEEEHASHRAAEERPKSGERIGDKRPKGEGEGARPQMTHTTEDSSRRTTTLTPAPRARAPAPRGRSGGPFIETNEKCEMTSRSCGARGHIYVTKYC